VPRGRARGAIHLHDAGPGVEHASALSQGLHPRSARAWSATPGKFAGSYPTVGPRHSPATPPGAGWIALGSYAKTYGFRIVGTPRWPGLRPAPRTSGGALDEDERPGAATTSGAGSGLPRAASINLPGAGTAITNPSAIFAWQESAHTMNNVGAGPTRPTAAQPFLGSTPYGPGRVPGGRR